ncbi:hypothetical protein CDD83_4129 [Cordyceps sp. RAO-2017]|nr:hypothetical protein CDD83_4129 [Cordyceps sp. RAO-2017]
MSSRAFAAAFRPLGSCGGPSTRCIASPRREFSSTPACAFRSIFVETGNTELDGVLKHIQEKIIFPSYLPRKQRKIVFDPRQEAYLDQNPVVIEVDGFEHKFPTINRYKDVENSKKVLAKALTMMKTARDWSNLGALLAGYRRAGIKLWPNHVGKITKVAASTGNTYALIECAKQVERTQFALDTPEVVARVLLHINKKVTDSDWSEKQTAQAFTWSQTVLDLLLLPEHTPRGARGRDTFPLSRLFRSMLLFTRAAAAKVKQQAGQDVEKDLALLGEEVALCTSLWGSPPPENVGQIPELLQLCPTEDRKLDSQIHKALNGLAYVETLAQAIKGITLSRELLGHKAEKLMAVREALDKHLAEFVRSGPGRWQGWEDAYEKVVGRAPRWPRSAEDGRTSV